MKTKQAPTVLQALNTPDAPLVSVVIVNYNSKRFLQQCIDALKKTQYPALEVIIVDNASADGSAEFLTADYSNDKMITLVLLSRNHGFSLGNNIGARRAHGKYIVFLNPDTEVDPLWLANAIPHFEADQTIGAAQPKLLRQDGFFDSSGGFLTNYGFGWCRDQGNPDKGQNMVSEEIFFAKGAALITRTELFRRIGGFDPLFFFFYDEIDLCWRIWMSGTRIIYLPTSLVHHYGSAVLRKHQYYVRYFEARGRIIMLMKNHAPRNLGYSLLPLLLLGPNLIRQIGYNDGVAAMAMIKGTFWWIVNFPKIWAARKKQEAIGLQYLNPLPAKRNIPFGYFSVSQK
jgi:GT2 family glycosyltransferase